jgi:small subunit ribosomal protein S20
MPNKKSAIKHLRQTEKRTSRNSLVKRNIKELIKQGKKAIADGSIKDKSGELTHSLQKAVDKAVKTGILKNNTGNRKKSRFADMVKKAGVAPKATVKKEAAKEEKK